MSVNNEQCQIENIKKCQLAEHFLYIFNLIGRLPVQSGKSQIFLTGTAYNTLTKVVGGRALI